MAELPTPLITKILSKLPVTSLRRFRCIAKSWRNLIDDQYFINLHLNHSSQNPYHQALMIKDCFLQDNFTNHDPYLYSVDYPTLNNATLINPPFNCDSVETKIVGFCNGVICFADGKALATFIQPGNEETPGFTLFGCRNSGNCVWFWYDHVNDDYKLVKVFRLYDENSDYHVSEVKVYSLKGNNWRRVSDFPSEYYIGYGVCWGAYVNGCLHWMVVRKPASERLRLIVAFDLGTEEYRVVPQPEYSRVDSKFFFKVGVFEGCLMVEAIYPKDRTDVWIMKEYGVKESWTRVFSVPQWGSLGFYEALEPIACLKEGDSEKVLIEQDFKKLVWLDLKQQSAKTVSTRGMPMSFDAVLVVQSLVSLESHKKKKKKKPKKKR